MVDKMSLAEGFWSIPVEGAEGICCTGFTGVAFSSFRVSCPSAITPPYPHLLMAAPVANPPTLPSAPKAAPHGAKLALETACAELEAACPAPVVCPAYPVGFN